MGHAFSRRLLRNLRPLPARESPCTSYVGRGLSAMGGLGLRAAQVATIVCSQSASYLFPSPPTIVDKE